jgi:glycosyltransferase involved in cell wall biosynthesis
LKGGYKIMQQEVINPNQPIIDSLINNDYKLAEKLAKDCISENPLNAQAWLYLAQSLAFQGSGQTAEKVFQRAWLLDPQAVWIEQARADLKLADLGKERKDIERLLEVKNVSVTAAIILKNEEKHIHNCLKNLVNAVDEIIIVDTGSTDNTIKIAKTFPKVKVIEFEWIDDFSAARNAALPHIENDWVIWIDADEYLYEEDVENVRIVAGIFEEVNAPILIRIGQMNKTNEGQIIGNFDMNRMFQLKYPFKFYSRIHEQIKLENKDMYDRNEISIPVKIRVYHEGYTSSSMNKKDTLNRNIKLLEKMVEDEPRNPAWLFFYGRELATSGRLDEGISTLLKAEECAKEYPNFGRVLDVQIILVNSYLAKREYDKAEEVCLRSMNIRNDFPDILYALARIKLEKGYSLLNEAEKHVVKAKESFETYRSIVSPDEAIRYWKADLLLSDICLYQGKIAKAIEGYEKSLLSSPVSAKTSIKDKLERVEKEIQSLRK